MIGFRKAIKINIIDRIIENLISYHAFWYEHDREISQFNYGYLRKLDSALISAVDRKSIGIYGLQNAFEFAGINPLCHLTGVLYGKKKNEGQRKERFFQVVFHLLLEVDGAEKLNDNTVNDSRTFLPPVSLQENSSYLICDEYNCTIRPITFRSVYAQGRRMFGDWASALKEAGFYYERIRRKKPKYPRTAVIQYLLLFLRERKDRFHIQEMRNHDLALYKGIFNSHNESLFTFANLSVMETAFLELKYHIRKQSEPDLSPEKFYKSSIVDKTTGKILSSKPSGHK
jgi:hypothetical protein